ncbi:MAG: CoA ester lyase [Alphaproteobacteria bacterium]|nr:CoA ester lyase [Alphaproteobacteria bacterium]
MSLTIRPRRTALYMPGSNARALEKARSLPTDTLLLDLEDAVAPESKDLARRQVCEAVAARHFGKREVVIRINGLNTPWGQDDLAAAASANPNAILVPKIDDPDEVQLASALLAQNGAAAHVGVWVMIETPLAIFNVRNIAGAGGRLQCLVMGTNDLVKEMNGLHTPGREGLLAALSLSVLAGRAYGLCVLDGVYNDIQDTQGFAASWAQGPAIGFDGKTVIHPSQLETCNAAFAPSEAEVNSARKILAAFDLPENKGKGAISLDGRMVELLHADIARRVVALAEAIEAAQSA